MDDEINQPSLPNYMLSILGAIASLGIFLLILFVAYLPNRPEPANIEIVEGRKATLSELTAQGEALAENYAWIDAKKGTVRIPVEEAKKLIVERLQKGK